MKKRIIAGTMGLIMLLSLGLTPVFAEDNPVIEMPAGVETSDPAPESTESTAPTDLPPEESNPAPESTESTAPADLPPEESDPAPENTAPTDLPPEESDSAPENTDPVDLPPEETGAADPLPEETAAEQEGYTPAEQTVTAVLYGVAERITPVTDETVITITGTLPEGITATAYPVSVGLADGEVLAAYDITLWWNGEEYQPENPVRVTIDLPRLEDVDCVDIYHMEDVQAEPELVAESVTTSDAEVSFDAASFSIYVVANNSAVTGTEITGGSIQITVGETIYLYSTKTSSWNNRKGLWYFGSGDFGNTSSAYATVTQIGTADNDHCRAALTGTAEGQVTLTYKYKVGSSWYYERATINIVKPVSITDNIAANGTLTAAMSAGYTGTYTYTWSKAGSESGTYSTVTDPGSSLGLFTEGGRSINVALDNGGLMWYKVTVTDAQSNVIGTATYQVTYGMQLRNGSFETPNNSGVTVDGQTGLMVQYPNHYDGLIWKTTGLGSGKQINKDIEIIRPNARNENGYAWSEYGINKNDANDRTADGEQFAELNCEAAGALYQDVLTAPGSDLFWSLYHRARAKSQTNAATKVDQMYVVIMSAQQAQYFETQISLDLLIAAVQAGQTTCNGHDISSVGLWEISDNAQQWYYHDNADDAYQVPSGQYLTRFFFVAGKTSTGDNTIGNYLDKVSFSQEIPYSVEYYVNGVKTAYTDSGTVLPGSTRADAASASHFAALNAQYTLQKTELGEGSSFLDYGTTTAWNVRAGRTILRVYFITKTTSVTINKTFSGLCASELPSGGYTVTFTLNGVNKSIQLLKDDFDPATTYTVTFTGVPVGNQSVTETASGVGTYQLTKVEGGTTAGTLADITGTKTMNLTVVANQSNVLYFTNTYTRTAADLTLLKVDENGEPLIAGFTLAEWNGSEWSDGIEYVTSDDGAAAIGDLNNGFYRLTETTTPDGYMGKVKTVYFTVAAGTITLTDEQKAAAEYEGYALSGAILTITNYMVYKLPSTGGMGTTMFKVVGVAVMAAAAGALAVYITRGKKRGDAEQERGREE